MKRSFPKPLNESEKQCSFTLYKLSNDRVPEYTIVKEYLYGRFDLFNLKGSIQEPDLQMIDIANRITKAFRVISLDSIIEMIRSEELEMSASDRVPLINNLEDPLFTQLSFLKDGPLDYETLGDLLPGCNAESPASKYKYGEICSKILALLDLVWIYKDNGTKVMLSPMGVVFRKLPLQERCVLFKKLTFRLEVIRNIFRTNTDDRLDSVSEVSKWLNGSTVKRRSQGINLLLKEINEETPY